MSTAPIPKTLLEAAATFSDKEVAWAYAVGLRWPNGVVCPFCAGKAHSFVKTRKTWQCKTCKKQFSVKKGSIFEDSPLGFDKWLTAMWLIVNAKNGISSYELHRSIGVCQKSAWFMLHRIRLAMQNGSFEKLVDHVEVDETYIGGKARNMHEHVRKTRITGTGGKDTYVSVEPFHLFRYLDEQSFRYNERRGNDAYRFRTLASQTDGKRLTYKVLTGKELAAASV